METRYDMCVDYDTLCEIEKKLKNISLNLGSSADSMLYALHNCYGFLAGQQFDKACQTTAQCSEISKLTISNISEVLRYISRLKECLELYSSCGFKK